MCLAYTFTFTLHKHTNILDDVHAHCALNNKTMITNRVQLLLLDSTNSRFDFFGIVFFAVAVFFFNPIYRSFYSLIAPSYIRSLADSFYFEVHYYLVLFQLKCALVQEHISYCLQQYQQPVLISVCVCIFIELIWFSLGLGLGFRFGFRQC